MSNPVALITGAARGIGRACALELARAGHDVVIADIIDTAEAVGAVEELGVDALGVACDVTDPDRRAAALTAIRERFGRLDCLINNAGVAPKIRADILEAGPESFDFVMGINLRGPYFLTQAVANWLIAQQEEDPTRRGRQSIVNVASLSSYTASPSRGEYCLSKAAVSMMTTLYAARLAEYEIRVNEVRPGIIATNMTSAVTEKYDRLIADGLTPIRRWGTPEDVARAVTVLAGGRLPFTTGEAINVDGGFHLRTL